MRLLSPQRRRIYPNPQTDQAMIPRLNPATVRGVPTPPYLSPAPDARTWDALKRAGWTEYDGPAEVDAFGYIVPGSDTAISR